MYSERFEDVYFSREDGLAETRHVFLAGNGLPEAWAGRARFTICETGFGTGLNVLAAWEMFERTSQPHQRLDIVSVEKYPLSAAEIAQGLAPWADQLGGRLEKLVAAYPLRVPGLHRLDFGRVRLWLIFDDANAALPDLEIPAGVDAWFLDGFAPAKNPEMWSETLYSAMARLSRPGARMATFTAAGAVRRGLAEAGFAVEKAPGYGRKRDMVVGRFCGAGRMPRQPASLPNRIAIIGGGLAGTACAHQMTRAGLAVTLFEREPALAAKASGNPRGLYNPKFLSARNPESDFYAAAFAQGHKTFSTLQNEGQEIGFSPCGAVHLLHTDLRERKLRGFADNGGWHEDHARIVDAETASGLAGIAVQHPALILPESGYISPAALCRAYAQGAELRLGQDLDALPTGFDAIILAGGAEVRRFADLPLHTVRGQIGLAPATPATAPLKAALCYGGYMAPTDGQGRHAIGATFQKWLESDAIREEDDADILTRLEQAVPGLTKDLSFAERRAGLRCVSRGHRPRIGRIAGRGDLYVSTAHGSHGLLSALAGASDLLDLWDDAPFLTSRRRYTAPDGD